MYNLAYMNNFSNIEPGSFFEGNERVRDLITLRRELKSVGENSDEIKRELCTRIHGLMNQPLRERIIAISEVDPELSAYIVALQSLNYLVANRTIPPDGFNPGAVPQAQSAPAQSVPLEVTKLTAHITSAGELLKLLKSEQAQINDRIEILSLKLQTYGTQLAKLAAEDTTYVQKETNTPVTTNTPVDVTKDTPVTTNTPVAMTAPAYDINLKDLPGPPDYSIDFEPDEYSLTAADLLE